jgi:predicted nucleic acid-binding protein
MSGERFTLDTNILVYSVDAEADVRREIAGEIIERAVVGNCWLTLQAVSEVYAAVTRKRVIPRDRAASLANSWLDLFPIASATVAATRVALAASATGHASYWDALLIATAFEAGCAAILTEDLADASTLHGVRILNPFAGGTISEVVLTLIATN